MFLLIQLSLVNWDNITQVEYMLLNLRCKLLNLSDEVSGYSEKYLLIQLSLVNWDNITQVECMLLNLSDEVSGYSEKYLAPNDSVLCRWRTRHEQFQRT